jgi:hypothetical protein
MQANPLACLCARRVNSRRCWQEAPRNLTVVMFLDKAPPKDALKTVTGRRMKKSRSGRGRFTSAIPLELGSRS